MTSERKRLDRLRFPVDILNPDPGADGLVSTQSVVSGASRRELGAAGCSFVDGGSDEGELPAPAGVA